jgi:hypothetical protein
MPTIKELLQNLDLGKSVAEFDKDLEEYFVETEAFRSLVHDRTDIVAGDKGTGKTAIYKILQSRFGGIQELGRTEVIPAFNPSGSPIFEKLGERGRLDEAEYIRIWKAYILSLAGNWLLGIYEGNLTKEMKQLDILLRGLGMRDVNSQAQNVFQKILAKIGRLFNFDSAEFEVSIAPDGTQTYKPKLTFNAEAPSQSFGNIPVETALRVLNSSLLEAGITLWIAVDRLDEAFQGYTDVEIPALRGLFRAYLDLLEFSNVKLKLFVRRDLFARITSGGFVNLTHINSRKFELIWDEEDLLNLLRRRI